MKEEKPMRLLSTVFTLCTVFPMVADAQEAAPAPAPAPAAPPPAVEPAPAVAAAPAPAPATPPPVAFGWEALVDAYYLYNFTGDPKTQGPRGRQFDTTANNFALNYAKLGVHADTDLVSFRMDFGAGHTAAIINSASGGSSAPATATAPTDTASLYGNGFLIQQAFATVKPTSYLTIDAGKFVTSASAEVIEANKNWLYSRSFLFTGVPLLHTGLRINGVVNPALTLSLQLVNGWNNDPDINSDKTIGFNATYAPPNQGMTAGFTTYIGNEGGTDGTKTRILLDAVFSKDIGNLSVGANVDYLKHDTAWWMGVAAMGRVILSDAFNVAARAEYLMSKKDGYIAPDPTAPSDASLYEITAQGAWTVGKHYELRLEFRADMSDKDVFAKGNTAKKDQVTGLLGALAYF
jgi:hypothetical protein